MMNEPTTRKVKVRILLQTNWNVFHVRKPLSILGTSINSFPVLQERDQWLTVVSGQPMERVE